MFDARDHLAGRIEALVGYLVRQRVVALMADAGEHGNVLVADEARQVVVIEQARSLTRAAAADQCDRIGRRPSETLRPAPSRRRSPALRLPLEPAVGIDEAADPKAFQPLDSPEIPSPCRILGRHHETIPGRLRAVVLEHLALRSEPSVYSGDGIDLQAETVRMEHRPPSTVARASRLDSNSGKMPPSRSNHGPGWQRAGRSHRARTAQIAPVGVKTLSADEADPGNGRRSRQRIRAFAQTHPTLKSSWKCRQAALCQARAATPGRQRPPAHGLERMLRIHFLQHWMGLGDLAATWGSAVEVPVCAALED